METYLFESLLANTKNATEIKRIRTLPISNDTNIDEEILRSIHQGTCENIPHPQ